MTCRARRFMEILCFGCLVMGVKRSSWLVELGDFSLLTSDDDDDDEEAIDWSLEWINFMDNENCSFILFTTCESFAKCLNLNEPFFYSFTSAHLHSNQSIIYGWLWLSIFYIAVLRVIIEKCEIFAFIFFSRNNLNLVFIANRNDYFGFWLSAAIERMPF